MAHRGRHLADDKLAAALAAGLTIRAAAADAGIGERTATRRMSEGGFRNRVSELRTAMVAAAAGKLADGMTAAADVLRGQLQSADEGIRHRAAVKLIEWGSKLVEVAELTRRLEEMEARLKSFEERSSAA